jgi:uncharacterized cupin superfamily protein
MIRRVVIAENGAGRSTVVEDGSVEVRSLLPVRDLAVGDVWGADTRCEVPTNGQQPRYERFFPPAEGFRVMLIRIGPERNHAASYDIATYQQRREQVLPGYFEDARVDDPGSELHRTTTVDVAVILEGEVELRLDDNQSVSLKHGDWVVQNGARHSWHNPGESACVIAVFVVGADEA